jgi:hypothetical protein
VSAGKYNMTICQGSDYILGLTIKDAAGVEIDLTGYTFTGQIRKTVSDSTVQASFSFTILDQVTLTGRVDVTLAAAISSAMLLDKSTKSNRTITVMTYDLESDDGLGNRKRWLEGIVNISPEATR